MKELTKKELHKVLTDQFVADKFSSFLILNPGKRSEAALYAAGHLQYLLIEALAELPHHSYKSVINKLKG